MSHEGGVGAIVLAAGRARRFGADKRVARLMDGQKMLMASLERCVGCFDAVRVVLRGDDDAGALLGAAQHEVEVVRAMNPDAGMGLSISAGAAGIGHWRAACIVLGDMPWIEARTLREVIEAWRAHPSADRAIVRPHMDGRDGHPVCFGSAHFAALASLDSDRGAQAIVDAERASLMRLAVEDPGVLLDVDTPEALSRAPRLESLRP